MILEPPNNKCASCEEVFKDFDIAVQIGFVREYPWPTSPDDLITTFETMKGHYHVNCIRKDHSND